MSKMKQPWHSKASVLQNTLMVLKQRQGASLAQIRKRLELKSSNGKVDAIKNKMLTSTLKGLVEKGKIEKNGGIYKLARGVPEEEEGVPSRRHRTLHHGGYKIQRHSRRRRHHKRRRSRRQHSRRRRQRHSQRRHHKRRRHQRRKR